MQFVLSSSFRNKLKPTKETKKIMASVPSNKDNLLKYICMQHNNYKKLLEYKLNRQNYPNTLKIPFHSFRPLTSNINKSKGCVPKRIFLFNNPTCRRSRVNNIFLWRNIVVCAKSGCVFDKVPVIEYNKKSSNHLRIP